MKLEVMVEDLDETKSLAESLSKMINPGTVILLNGTLGAGKTTFTQFIGESLGVKRRMSSPTFNIIKSYSGLYTIHHMDCYRLEHSDEDLGFYEYFNPEDVSIIEWPHFIEDFLPDEFLKIDIENNLEQSRIFSFTAEGRQYDLLLEDLKNDISVN